MGRPREGVEVEHHMIRERAGRLWAAALVMGALLLAGLGVGILPALASGTLTVKVGAQVVDSSTPRRVEGTVTITVMADDSDSFGRARTGNLSVYLHPNDPKLGAGDAPVDAIATFNGVSADGSAAVSVSLSTTCPAAPDWQVSGCPSGYHPMKNGRYNLHVVWSLGATSDSDIVVDNPPAAPSSFTGAQGDSGIVLSWHAGAEPDVTGYSVKRGAVDMGSVAGSTTSVLDSGAVLDGRTYDYTLQSFRRSAWDSKDGRYSASASPIASRSLASARVVTVAPPSPTPTFGPTGGSGGTGSTGSSSPGSSATTGGTKRITPPALAPLAPPALPKLTPQPLPEGTYKATLDYSGAELPEEGTTQQPFAQREVEVLGVRLEVRQIFLPIAGGLVCLLLALHLRRSMRVV